MFFARIIKRSFAYRSQKYVLFFLILLFGSTILSFSLSTSLSIKQQATQFLSSTGSHLSIFPEKFFDRPELFLSLEQGVLKRIREFLDTNRIEYVLTPYFYTIGSSQNTPVVIVGTDFSALRRTRPYIEVDEPGVWVGWRVADRWNLSKGDTIILSIHKAKGNFPIAGILQTGGEEDAQVFLPVDIFSSFIPEPEPTFGEIQFLNLEMEKIASIQEKLKTSFGVEVKKPEDLFRSFRDFALKIEGILWSITGLILISVLIVSFSMALFTISERTKEIAILKTLGADKFHLTLLFFTEALFLGILSGFFGFLLGYGIGYKIGPYILNTPLNFHPLSFFITIVITGLLTILGFLYPLKRILPLKPAGVMKGE